MSTDPFQISVADFDQVLEVVRFEGRQSMNRLGRLEVVVSIPSIDVRRLVDELVGREAELQVLGSEGPARRMTGVVAKVRALAPPDPEERRSWLSLVLRPRLWLAKRNQSSRVFQALTTEQIVTEVLASHGVRHTWRLTRTYAARTYCLQYQESDYRFVQRLLADEGIFFWFDDSEGLVLADDPRACGPLDGEATLRFAPEAGMVTDGDHLSDFEPARAVAPTLSTVRHFDPERPHLGLEASAERTPDERHRIEVYDFRYEVQQEEVARHVAESARDQGDRLRFTMHGSSPCRRVMVGRTFRLADHVDGSMDGDYAIFDTRIEGARSARDGGSAEATFEVEMLALPATIAARPRRRRWRLVQMTESAFVTGPPGEEIHVDELGRIKVQFHWDRQGDRTDRSSCWIRVTQPWAGSAWGSQFLPRVGMEVLVAFVGGDVDRPVVVGSLYNGASPLPFPLPEHKTQSGIRTQTSPGGDGFNELRFEDAAGREQIYLRAERDFETRVENDLRRTVGGYERVHVKKDRDVAIEGDRIHHVVGNEVTTVERSRVVHVIGRQLIEVDGTVTDDGPDEAAPPPVETHLQLVKPSGAALAAAKQTAVRGAAAIVASAHLAPSLIPLGDMLEGMTRAGEQELEPLRAEVLSLEGTLQRIERTAVPTDAPSMNTRAVFATARAARELDGTLNEQARQTTERRREAQSRKNGALERVAFAVDAALETQQAEVTQLRERTAQVQERCKAMILEGQSGRLVGGGGATTGWKTVPEMQFWKRPDSTGMRTAKTVKGGSQTVIKGGGEIKSPDGFRVSANGCSIELSDGNITLDASYIALQGKTVEIISGDINIDGHTTNVSGMAKVLVKGGVVNVVGAPITLN